MNRLKTLACAAIASLLFGGVAQAVEGAGQPIDAGHQLQSSVTPVMDDITWVDDFLHAIILLIVLLVVALMVYAIINFSAKKNPTPKTFTHHPTLEVIWMAAPVLILIIIAIPSLKLLFLQTDVPEPDLTIKAIGNQWNWTYEYPEEGIEFTAYMIGQGAAKLNDDVRAELEAAGYKPEEFRLATDERVVVPVNAKVHVLVTATDVIHAWTIPSFGSKIDAMPGRINETWFQAREVGTYFGQCSELCGKDHAYMPIVVEVVSEEDYKSWVSKMAARDAEPTTNYALAD